MATGIYQIVNTITQKRYIGYASVINTRFNGHKYDLRNNIHGNSYLQYAWNKYGSAAFKFEILQECSLESLCFYEDYWVKILKVDQEEFGYNIKPTDPNSGRMMHSAETIEKIRAKNKGKRPSDFCIQRSKESKVSPEGRIRQLEGLAKVDWFELRKDKRKKVINIETNQVYDSLKDLSIQLGIPKYELSRRLLGKRKNNTPYQYL